MTHAGRISAHHRHVVALAFVLCALWAGSAAAATTRFASTDGTSASQGCTDAAAPCSLPTALGDAQADDSISLAAGSYDVQAVALPQIPLHWVATDGATRPVVTSAGGSTLFLTTASSGSTFRGLELDNTSVSGIVLEINDGTDLTVSSSIIKGPRCLAEADGDQVPGQLTIEDSTLSSPVGRTCAFLGSSSVLRRSSVSLTDAIATQTPPPAVISEGLVEDTQIDGGLQLFAPGAVARRVRATGSTAIFGQGLVVDSLASAIGSRGAAIAASAPQGGVMRAINVTAIAPLAPALAARGAFAPNGTPVTGNTLVVSNAIARGAPTDLRATSTLTCAFGFVCEPGQIRIDHSNFVTREPAAGAPGDAIELGPGNQSGDPLFSDLAPGDVRLLAGSPAIDAGADPQGRALPTDLDGHPRLQGAAIDLGAYEFSPPAPLPIADPPPGTGIGPTDTPPPADTTAPQLGGLHLSRTRFRAGAGTTLSATTTESGQLSAQVQRRLRGRRVRWAQLGPSLSRRVTAPGAVTLRFHGRVGTRRLAPGAYRFVVSATDLAGNASAPRTISFRIVAAHNGSRA